MLIDFLPVPDDMWWIAHDGAFYSHPYNPNYTYTWDGTAEITAALGLVNLPATDGEIYVTEGTQVLSAGDARQLFR